MRDDKNTLPLVAMTRYCEKVGPEHWDWDTKIYDILPGETVEHLARRVLGAPDRLGSTFSIIFKEKSETEEK